MNRLLHNHVMRTANKVLMRTKKQNKTKMINNNK